MKDIERGKLRCKVVENSGQLYFISRRKKYNFEASDNPFDPIKIPETFIRKYIESGKTIQEVEIKLDFPHIDSTVTTRPDGTVIISKVKDSWNKEEIEDFVYEMFTVHNLFLTKEGVIDRNKIKNYLKEEL